MSLVRRRRRPFSWSRGRAAGLAATMFLRAVAVGVASAATLAVAGCSTAASVIPGTGPLVAVEMRGGLCPEGMCATTVILERDGRVHRTAKPPKELGVVPADALSTLTVAVAATDYAALTAKPFTGDCPTAFDGQELIFEFAAAGGARRVASCDVAIDWGHPLFSSVAAALGEWVPLPRT